MRKIICIVFILSAAGCWGQYPILRPMHMRMQASPVFSFKPGDYYRDMDNMYEAYVGTWKYTGNGKIFTLKLQKKNRVLFKLPGAEPSPVYYYIDYIVLTYKLQNSDGSIIYDNTSLIPTNIWSNQFGYLDGCESIDFINGSFKDFTTNVLVSRCKIKKIATNPGEPEKVFFELYENYTSLLRESLNAPVNYIPGVTPLYSVPNRVELIKQP